jgi:lipid-A-disaccharide synthase
MAAEDVELLAGLTDLAVMGFVEVLSRLPFFWNLERQVGRLIDDGEFDLVIPVDYPGFNLRITERAHAAGVPVVYYIAPQVWAWKAGRTVRLSRAADRIAVILPFEEAIFRKAGANVEFVGHPLLDQRSKAPSREEYCATYGLDPHREILALFPGSREQEIRRHLECFIDAGRLLRQRRPGLQLVIAQADGIRLQLVDHPDVVAVWDARPLLSHARAAIVKSGTSTLEAALAGTPFVVAYRTHPWTSWLARRLVQVDHVALANLVADERVVPEILQDRATPAALAGALAPLLEEGEEREEVLTGLARVRSRLGQPGAATRVARLAREVLGRVTG